MPDKSPDTEEQHALRERLFSCAIGPEGAALTFEARLARENRWTADFAARVIQEYRRFCFLAITAGHEVTPSDAVDQAWHLHLTYSRDYWQHFCPVILRADLHHGPTAGGQVEKQRYYDQYAATLAAYETAFGETAPLDIWPPAARRFGIDPLYFRINPKDAMVISRRWLLPSFAALVGLMAVAFILGGMI